MALRAPHGCMVLSLDAPESLEVADSGVEPYANWYGSCDAA